MTTATEAFTQILDAKRPEDLFGKLEDYPLGLSAPEQIRTSYRNLARQVHPDSVDDEDKDVAQRAFSYLTDLFNAALRAIELGVYGTDKSPLVHDILIQTRRKAYKITQLWGKGDACNFYRCTYQDEKDEEQNGLIKVARDPADNDLVANEGKALKRLLSNSDTYDKLEPYVPQFIETFGYKIAGSRKPHQALSFGLDDRMFSLEEVRRQYPTGIAPKQMAWMFRRLLMTLGLVHINGIVHGAVLPPHILIQPEQHGLVLIDWKYSTKPNTKITAISSRFRNWYPYEVWAKDPAQFGTDIYLAVRSMVYILGGDPTTGALPEGTPVQLEKFFSGITLRYVKRRPQDALKLLEEFNELLELLWGERKFIPFYMP